MTLYQLCWKTWRDKATWKT